MKKAGAKEKRKGSERKKGGNLIKKPRKIQT